MFFLFLSNSNTLQADFYRLVQYHFSFSVSISISNHKYTDKDYKNKYDFNTKITSDITLYAKWEKSDKTDEEIDKNNKYGEALASRYLFLNI